MIKAIHRQASFCELAKGNRPHLKSHLLVAPHASIHAAKGPTPNELKPFQVRVAGPGAVCITAIPLPEAA